MKKAWDGQSGKDSAVSEYIYSLKRSQVLGHQVVFHKELSSVSQLEGKLSRPLSPQLQQVLSLMGISGLYLHQARAIDLIRNNRHVVVATPTASGKTLIYNLPVLERQLEDPSSKALYLFPLKALAQDQLRTLSQLSAAFPSDLCPEAALYDGDTPPATRRRLRQMPPNILMTNPEMLHLSLLPYHHTWSTFWKGLTHVVVDEVHTYRGVMGSHMAWVFRRLRRICRYYGREPVFVFCSATVGNPGQLCSKLTGLEVESVTESGAPVGRRHIVFINPDSSPAHTAVLLLRSAIARGLRTIVYTQSRKLTELIGMWASSQLKEDDQQRISTYRSGYLPEERRQIEKDLATGRLLAVISTSALELGIDIGTLDICILVGYPGTVMATRQRGGRVGRGLQDSAMVLIAQEDALDQYFMRNPEDLIKRPPEAAVLNPVNPRILSRHLECAAAELPVCIEEPEFKEEAVHVVMEELVDNGKLFSDEQGRCLHPSKRYPHRGVDLRGTGSTFQIIDKHTGSTIGSIDGFRAYRETHPGAVYIHLGQTYVVDELDLDTRQVLAVRQQVDYFTRVLAQKETTILELWDKTPFWNTWIFLGRIRVKDQVIGYEKKRVKGQERLGRVGLDLPAQEFETEGMWLCIPHEIESLIHTKRMHFMGGIHALEHATIGVLPLLVLTDRGDLGGISTTFHPQVKGPAVFVYDGIPGGVGLCRQAFSRSEELFKLVLKAIKDCPCKYGCPSCVHSPKCGSGNRPIDKDAAIVVLEALLNTSRRKPAKQPQKAVKTIKASGPATSSDHSVSSVSPSYPQDTRQSGDQMSFGVFDLETQLSAQEVGGWHRAELMKVSCAVLYDSRTDEFKEFLEKDVQLLVEHLSDFDLVVGFNVKRFDYRVLKAYTEFDLWRLPTLDILEEVHKRLGYRLSLDHLASVTLGAKKTANGLQALRWWKQGKIEEIVRYCRQDVALTKDLFLYGKQHGHLLFRNKAGNTVRVKVSW